MSRIRPHRIALVLLVPAVASGQSPDSLTARFQQELDTRTWRVEEAIRSESESFRLVSFGYGELTERSLQGYESQWKNDFDARIDASRRLTDVIELELELQGQDFQDRRAPFLSDRGAFRPYPADHSLESPPQPPSLGQDIRISRSITRAGLSYTPNASVEGRLLVGGSFDRQLEGSGGGISGRGSLFWADVAESGVDVEADGWLNRYGDRRNHRVFARVLTVNEFGDAHNQLATSWQNRRSDLFFGSDGQIVNRISDEIQVDNRLSAPLHDRISGEYNLSFRKRSVDYHGGGPGPSDETDFIHNLGLTGYWRRWTGDLTYRIGLEDRTYGELILGRNQVLTVRAERRGISDTLRIRTSGEKWRYNSPDSLETSDRDRLIYRVTASASVLIMPGTRVTVDAFVLLDHLVNLHRERSADNRWNRVFRLAPGVVWTPGPGWRNRAQFELLANYTDYDFESAGATVRSNVFRRWSASDTLRLPLPLDAHATVSGRIDLEDRGRLQWSRFVQQVSDEKRAWYWSASLAREFWSHLVLTAGYHVQRREEDRLDPGPAGGGERTRITNYHVYGPFFRARTRDFSNLYISVEVALQNVEDSNASDRDRLDRIDVSLVYRW